MTSLKILLVEDNPDDVDLTREALQEADVPNRLTVAEDGVEALAILHQEGDYADTPLPDLILLDLNLPRKSGFDVLEDIKADLYLRRIPVIVLTTSDEMRDVFQAYERYANGYVIKPIDLDEFIGVVKAIAAFWGTVVTLPSE